MGATCTNFKLVGTQSLPPPLQIKQLTCSKLRQFSAFLVGEEQLVYFSNIFVRIREDKEEVTWPFMLYRGLISPLAKPVYLYSSEWLMDLGSCQQQAVVDNSLMELGTMWTPYQRQANREGAALMELVMYLWNYWTISKY